ncbi:3-phenylpropionate/trans-cinnamate dioxygenase ferredoxin reductase subunit [Asanoa ferruginea]|uniref:3-phenylpropionate/trans-cinnamate dioxygenase ferredoxin reductase subunit n=1 Tax=Asanoa ferruginea TaxID=53367 RepID=A0A3D9ZQX9_9ACTN|nr:FAD-dependent oxidoreductase [Asanoa ferruginea]REF99788.1 3-phenylpropionate/trans-cinnamate dioxygenase ferredoxin reductase subunit [Asanoa ferruginea]GIF52499.1 ferredoxin [Asanoa ferruginea]
MARGEDVGTLIIGASQAGLQLATTLRDLGATGTVTLLGGESRAPYQRPPLSKGYLRGTLPEDRLALRTPEFYRTNGIDLISGEWVEGIHLTDPGRGAGEATTRSGRTLRFDRLALTVGGAPRRLNLPGHELAGIHYLRDVDDAASLRADLDAADRFVVVGGGFVGLEAAAAATAAGKDVTVVETAPRLLERAVAPVMSDFVAAAHRRRGTTILLNSTVSGFAGTGRVDAVELSDGRVLPADAVVVGIGLLPHTALAEQLGLTCAGGIVVDESARSSNPTVVAAGDCTVIAHPDHGSLRLESVQNAIAQAKTAAATLLGREAPDTGTPWFWSDQADLKLQMAGINTGYDEVVLRGDPASEQFSALYYRAGRLLSIDAVNAPRDYMAVRRLLDGGRSIPAEAAADTAVALKEFLRATA